MKKLLGFLVTFIMLFSMVACGWFGKDELSLDEGTVYTSIDINPTIEFILDDEKLVVSVSYVNKDAEIVAADLQLIGIPFAEALELYINAAIATGYIDVDIDENIVTVMSDDADLEDAIKADIEGILTEKGIGAAIFGGEMSEEYVVLAEQYDISIGRARLISRAIEIDDSLTFETALELTHQEIMNILVTAHVAMMNEFTAQRQQESIEIKEQMAAGALERVNQHADDLDAGLIDTPDYNAIRNYVEENIEAIRTQYQQRMNQARQDAEDFIRDRIPNSE